MDKEKHMSTFFQQHGGYIFVYINKRLCCFCRYERSWRLENSEEIVQKVQGVLSSIIDPVLSPLRGVIPPTLYRSFNGTAVGEEVLL